MNGFSELFPAGGNLYSKLPLFDSYDIAFQMKGPLGDKLVAGIVLAPIFDGDGFLVQSSGHQMTGLRQGFSRIDAVFNHGAQAFFLLDIADFSFDQRDTHIVADDVTSGVVIFVVAVDKFVLQSVDFHYEIGCLIRRGRCTGARKPYTYAQKKIAIYLNEICPYVRTYMLPGCPAGVNQ